ncbi:MAG: hypothetical protein FWC26_13570 [Fibromonadales bacterium]|nr:hypothetical protein [Fibromonadales bacterium]
MENNETMPINRTRDIFLAEPLSVKGRKALRNINMVMTEDELYEDVYVKPFTKYTKRKTEKISFDQDPDTISYYDEVDTNKLCLHEEAFRNKLADLSESVFVMQGVAGSGKSTYLHKIKRLLSDSIEFHIHNFEETRQSISFMSSFIDLGSQRYKSNIYKFISTLLKETSNLLSKGEKTSDDYKNYIKEIINVYYKYLHVTEKNFTNAAIREPNADTEDQQKLFDILHRYVNMENNYDKLSEQLISKIKEKILSENSNRIDALSYVAGFLIRLYFCLSVMRKKKHLCVIDNIEDFVIYDENNPVQVCELECILSGCIDATKIARGTLIAIQKEASYRTFYGFLIVTRDTTASTILFQREDHLNDFKRENEIDVSDWFCTDDIYKKKKLFCIKKGVHPTHHSYEKAYENILGDISAYRWGLNGIVSKMYKCSHRRNAECITGALSAIPLREIEYFNDMWEKTQNVGSDSIINLKALCRKYILRILIDHVQQTNYFDKLMVENVPLAPSERSLEHYKQIINSKPQRLEGSSYARKISTILHRFAVTNGVDNYVSFPRLIDSMFKRPYLPNTPTDAQIEKMGKILFLMNETRHQKTNWTSLICLKFSSEVPYNEGNLYAILLKQWEAYKNQTLEIDDTFEYGVKITDAGSFFAKLLPDFEYFTCRFLTYEPPLFSKENIKSFLIDDEKIFRAIAIMRIIRKKAFDCVDDVIDKDYSFFASNGQKIKEPIDFSSMFEGDYSWAYKDSKNDFPLTHPYRVLTQHSGYIANYIDYVSRFIPEKEFEKTQDKKQLLELAIEEQKLYKDKLSQLEKKYPEYLQYKRYK